MFILAGSAGRDAIDGRTGYSVLATWQFDGLQIARMNPATNRAGRHIQQASDVVDPEQHMGILLAGRYRLFACPPASIFRHVQATLFRYESAGLHIPDRTHGPDARCPQSNP